MYVSVDIAFPEQDAPTKVGQLSNRKREDIEDAVRSSLESQGLLVDRVEIFDD